MEAPPQEQPMATKDKDKKDKKNDKKKDKKKK